MTEHPGRKGGLIAIIILFLLLLGAYLGTAYYFRSHFFPKTVVNRVDAGTRTADYIERINVRTGEDYLLTVTDRDGDSYRLRGMDFGYDYVHTGEEQRLLDAQNAFIWPFEIAREHTYTLTTSYVFDEAALTGQILELGIFSKDYTAPQDAYLQLNEEGVYELVPEVQGNTPIDDVVLAEITQAVSEAASTYTLSDACYETPDIYADDEILSKEFDEISSFSAATIHYEIDGADENLSPADIVKLLIIGDDHSVTVDEGKVEDYVQHLASTYNTYADVRSFRTTEGDTIEIGGGDYGWVINKPKEKEQILADLAGGVPVSREPVYEQTAMQSGLDDIGDTYVEVDYTNQHLYYYEDGRPVLDSDLVSGNINRGNGSPDGIFKIVYKQSPATLVGEDYESDVTFFMPFAYNVGFHDASWRSKFGGDIYKHSGSHGCVNVPYETAEALYQKLAVGTPVVAYYREEVELTSENAQISNAFSYVKPDEDEEDE